MKSKQDAHKKFPEWFKMKNIFKVRILAEVDDEVCYFIQRVRFPN